MCCGPWDARLRMAEGALKVSDLGIGEFAAGINERRDGGIAPQFHRKGQILDLPWPRHKALGPEFFRVPHDRRRDGPIPALHSDTVASGAGSSNPARSSSESVSAVNRRPLLEESRGFAALGARTGT